MREADLFSQFTFSLSLPHLCMNRATSRGKKRAAQCTYVVCNLVEDVNSVLTDCV